MTLDDMLSARIPKAIRNGVILRLIRKLHIAYQSTCMFHNIRFATSGCCKRSRHRIPDPGDGFLPSRHEMGGTAGIEPGASNGTASSSPRDRRQRQHRRPIADGITSSRHHHVERASVTTAHDGTGIQAAVGSNSSKQDVLSVVDALY
jgi:hypothetical protein